MPPGRSHLLRCRSCVIATSKQCVSRGWYGTLIKQSSKNTNAPKSRKSIPSSGTLTPTERCKCAPLACHRFQIERIPRFKKRTVFFGRGLCCPSRSGTQYRLDDIELSV